MLTRKEQFKKDHTRAKCLLYKKFGRLIVTDYVDEKRWGGKRIFWLCECNCGNVVKVCSGELVFGDTKSCGCYKKDQCRCLINHNYFSQYADEACFIAGWWGSDGNVACIKNRTSYSVNIQIASYDKHVLEWIKEKQSDVELEESKRFRRWNL